MPTQHLQLWPGVHGGKGLIGLGSTLISKSYLLRVDGWGRLAEPISPPKTETPGGKGPDHRPTSWQRQSHLYG